MKVNSCDTHPPPRGIIFDIISYVKATQQNDENW